MPRKTKPTGKTKLGMDKKYLNEDIYIYQNPEVESRGIVELEVIEKYEGRVYINDKKEMNRLIEKHGKEIAITKFIPKQKRKTFDEKYKDTQMKMSKIKSNHLKFLNTNKENTNNCRYFPLKSKYELQLIADVLNKDRNYLEWWYENSLDKEEERNRYIKSLLNNEIMFQFSDEN
jgi:transposase-like protein